MSPVWQQATDITPKPGTQAGCSHLMSSFVAAGKEIGSRLPGGKAGVLGILCVVQAGVFGRTSELDGAMTLPMLHVSVVAP